MLFVTALSVAIIVKLFPIVAADPGPPYILTFTPWGYAAQCDLNDLNNASAYRGYEVELIRDAMEIANLTYGVDIVLQCALLDWSSDSILIGYNDSEAIIGSFGSYPIESIPLNVVYSFSVSTMRSGLSIIYVKDTGSEITQLFYFQSFTWELYLVLLLLPLLLGLMVYIFQMREQNWFNFVYNFYLYFFKLEFIKNLKGESRLLELAFLAVITVIVTLYTARLTDVLAGQKKFGGVSTIDDLKGVRVCGGFLSQDYIKNLGARFVQVNGIGEAIQVDDSYKKLGEILRNSSCPYCMIDTEMADLFVQEECDFQIALKNVIKTDYGIVWPEHAPEEIKTKMDYGILKALETKSEYVRRAETLTSFGSQGSCPLDLDRAHVTVKEVAGLWIVWLCFLAISSITFLTSFLLKRYCRLNRTPFDQELRGKSEGLIKSELSTYCCGNILISLHFLREYKQFLLENSRYCSEKLNLKPEILQKAQLLLNNEEEMISLASPSRTNREDSIIPISPKKTTRLQNFISRISPRSLKRSSDSSSPSIILLESPKNIPAFRKELNNAAKRLNKNSFAQFSKEKMNNLIIQFATRQTETLTTKEKVIKALSIKFNLKSEPMRRRFIDPQITSTAKLLQDLTLVLSKKKQPKNKLLSELLYLDYKTAFVSNQPLNKSAESSIVLSLVNLEEKNKKEQEILRPPIVESLLQIQKERKRMSPEKKTKKWVLDSFSKSAKPMNLKLIDLNQTSSV